ncbi:MAG TPA: tetratricopeptide repeat protein [Pyrinomonadaceae bacterium]|jgi:hypothetical protein|nr:tetratricopeptide repeat protein [Pyrinomonadaceae bacterium]
MERTPEKLVMTCRASFRFELLVLIALLWCTGSAGTTCARASQTSSIQAQNGIELYEKGDFPQAIKILKDALKKDKNNVKTLHYLGLAYEGALRRPFQQHTKGPFNLRQRTDTLSQYCFRLNTASISTELSVRSLPG